MNIPIYESSDMQMSAEDVFSDEFLDALGDDTGKVAEITIKGSDKIERVKNYHE